MPRRARLLILATLALGPPRSEPAIPVTVHGQVLASTDTTPIRWAQVYLAGTHFGAATDTLGYFRLAADLPVGGYILIIRAIGYDSASRSLHVDTAGIIELGAIVMRAAPNIAVEDLIVAWTCTRYRQQPTDSLRRFVRKKGRDEQGRYWEVCKD
jgi:carboxypeptidase-like protein